MAPSENSILPGGRPPGCTVRTLTLADAAADLESACSIALTGKPCIEAGEIRSDWQTPTMNLATNTLAVCVPDGVPVGLAEVWANEPFVHNFVFAEVHPGYRGLGIGSSLAAWAEAAAIGAPLRLAPGALWQGAQTLVA